MSRWLRTFVPRPDAELCLVCFPHAGGSATAYHDWVADLPDRIEVVAVQYPGRADRLGEPAHTTTSPLADAVVDALEDLVERPYPLFGAQHGRGRRVRDGGAAGSATRTAPSSSPASSGRPTPITSPSRPPSNEPNCSAAGCTSPPSAPATNSGSAASAGEPPHARPRACPCRAPPGDLSPAGGYPAARVGVLAPEGPGRRS